MKKVLLICVWGVLFATGLAQTGDDVSKYFDESGPARESPFAVKYHNAIKVSPLSLIPGDLPILYEHVFSRNFGVEVGIGVIMPHYIGELYVPINDDEFSINWTDYYDTYDVQFRNKTGYSLLIQPKIYTEFGAIGHTAPEGVFFGFQYRRRFYPLVYGNDLYVTDITLNNGYQVIKGKHFLIGYDVGIGARIIRHEGTTLDTNEYKEEKVSTISSPFRINIGLAF